MTVNSYRTLCCGLAALIGIVITASHARATPLVDVGNWLVAADTPGQQIPLFITGNDLLDALDLKVQIGDGGTAAGFPAGTGPTITFVDIAIGTIFSCVNVQLDVLSADPQFWDVFEIDPNASGVVQSDGLLATITIDTTGWTTGTWSLSIFDTLNGPTVYNRDSSPPTVTNAPLDGFDGSIQISESAGEHPIRIVPEPSTLFLAACSLPLLAFHLRRRRATVLAARKT